MQEPVQAPVSRTALQEWLEDRYGIFMDVYQGEDTVLRLYNETCFPEINVLCAGEAEKFTDTVEICGMYDKRTREFRFVSSQLSSIINGISKEECCSDSGQSESIYAGICCYAKEAVEQRGYTFEDSTSELYAGLRQAVQTGLSAMVDYAAVLSAGGKRNAVLDARDLALKMLYFWRDSVYLTYEKGYARVEQEYAEKFDQAVRMAEKTGQAPAFSGQKAKDILQSLAIHATEVTDNEDAFSVWECCRLAKRLLNEYPQHRKIFRGDFTVDESERFMKFGSKDWDHLQGGWLLGKEVLVFNSPVPDEQIPEGWHSYHLAGRNFSHIDRLLKAVPESGYAGTVLSPHVLIRASYQSREIRNHFLCYGGYTSLTEYCEKLHLPQPDMSGIASEQQEGSAAPQMMTHF